MQRREFITLVGGAAAAWPIATRAQQPARLPTIGFLGSGAPFSMNDWIDAFVQRLSELRWVVGNTVAIEYRWAEARNDRFAELAAEFVRLKVDAIVTAGTPSVLALMQATSFRSCSWRWGAPVPTVSSSPRRDQKATSPACQI